MDIKTGGAVPGMPQKRLQYTGAGARNSLTGGGNRV